MLRPTFRLGAAGHKTLLIILKNTNDAINAATDALGNDAQAYEVSFDSILGTIKGIAAMVSRQPGFLGSKRIHAEKLRASSDKKGCLYKALAASEFYCGLMREFWETIEICEKHLGKVKPLTAKVQRAGGKIATVEVNLYLEAMDFYAEFTPKLRPTQTDGLRQALIEVAEKTSQGVASEGFIEVLKADIPMAEHLLRFVKTASESLGTVPSADGAKGVLDKLLSQSAEQHGQAAFKQNMVTMCAELLKMDSRSIADIESIEVEQLLTTECIENSVSNDSPTEPTVIRCMAALVTLMELPTKPAPYTAISHRTVATSAMIVTLLKQLRSTLAGPKAKELDANIDSLVSLQDWLVAVLNLKRLGPDNASRLAANQDLSLVRSAKSALESLQGMVKDGETIPGWLTATIEEAQTLIDDLKTHVVAVRLVPVKSVLPELEAIQKHPIYSDPDHASHTHFLDECDYIDSEDVDELVKICGETCFVDKTITADKLNTVIPRAQHISKKMQDALDIFSADVPDEQS